MGISFSRRLPILNPANNLTLITQKLGTDIGGVSSEVGYKHCNTVHALQAPQVEQHSKLPLLNLNLLLNNRIYPILYHRCF